MTDQYAVVGNPIAHSKSPIIHSLFAKQTSQDLNYVTLLAPLDGFRESIMHFFNNQHGKGLNVTVPFKLDAWSLCKEQGNELSDYAKLAGAVNTLVQRDDGSIYGTTTDGIGLVIDLENNNKVALKDKKVLILGAGGAVRGVIQPILERQPAELFIANRTVSKADDLAALFQPFGDIKGGGFDTIPNHSFDIIINGTAASLHDELPPVAEHHIKQASCCYDMMYSNEPTAFVKWTKGLGVEKSLDGLGMLIEQAAESFSIWRGVRPNTQEVFLTLRDA